MITQMCPFCMKEQTVEWDAEKDGYAIYCPACGHRLVLCDECIHNRENAPAD